MRSIYRMLPDMRRKFMILDTIVADKKIRLKEQKKKVPLEEVRRRAQTSESGGEIFYRALKKKGISIIGEFKRSSPSLGKISSKISLASRMQEYNASVDAISCLTEEDHFSGSIEYLKAIRTLTKLPILRKDFMIDEYQFYEAKAIRADAVLLIAAILDDAQMKAFLELADELGLDVLAEVHDAYEMERVLKLDAKIIGVNNRDLKDFTIRLETTEKLSSMVPKEKIFVSESGITKDADVAFLKRCGVDAFLIGRAFMESENPKELAMRWKR